MLLVSLLVITVLFSFVFTLVLRKYAISKGIIDVPNDRSSHSIPTPRGGGVAIVVTFCIGVIFAYVFDVVSLEYAVLILLASAVVSIVGFMDDHGHINAGIRLFCHFLSATLITYLANGLPALQIFNITIEHYYLGFIFAVFSCVWMLNLFNFMDGIDGIAGVEAVTTTFIMGLLTYFVYDSFNIALLHFLLGAASLGFLILNFPPAKIFMGDAGSGFIGIMLATLLLLSGHVAEELLWGGLTMMGVFIVDSTFTLIRRLINGNKPHEAHRSHAYQFASRIYGNHFSVTFSVLLINLLWLAPFAVLITFGYLEGAIGMILSYIPLVLLAVKYHAGENESRV